MSDFFDIEELPPSRAQKILGIFMMLILGIVLGILVIRAVEAQRNTQIIKELNNIQEIRKENPQLIIPSKEFEFKPFGETITIPQLDPTDEVPSLKEIVDQLKEQYS